MSTRKIVIMGDNGEQKTIELPADFDMSILEKAAAPKRVRKSSKVEYKLDESYAVEVTTNEKQNVIYFTFPNKAMCYLNLKTKKMYHGNNDAEFLPTHLNDLVSELAKTWDQQYWKYEGEFLTNLFRILNLVQRSCYNHYENIKAGKLTHLIENLEKYEKIAKHPITKHLDDDDVKRIAKSKNDYLQYVDKWFMERVEDRTAAIFGNYVTRRRGAVISTGATSPLSKYFFGYVNAKKSEMDDHFRHVWDNYKVPLLLNNNDHDSSNGALQFLKSLIKDDGYDSNRLWQYLFVDLLAQGRSYNGDLDNHIQTYQDYINMSEESSPDNFDKYPRYLSTAHDIVTQNYNMAQSEKLDKDFNTAVSAHANLAWDDRREKFAIIVPKTAQELNAEGSALSHCVASYAVRVAAGETMIVFMRDKNEINKPLVTIQVTNYDVIQAKGFGNRAPNAEQLEFITKYKKHLEKLKDA